MSVKRSEALRKLWQRPDYRAKHEEALKSSETTAKRKEAMMSSEVRAKVSEGLRKAWQRPTYGVKVSEGMRKAWQKPEFRAERIASMNRPEVKTRHREAMKRVWLNPESRAAHIEALICPESWARLSGENNPTKRPEVRAKLSGENSGAWKGGTSFLPYCRKFNDTRREEVRNDYERVCASCGKSELLEERRLSIHHVDGDKMQGCKRSDWFGLGGRWFLVPLCQSCHGKGLERDLYSVGMFWLAEISRRYWQRRIAA